MMATMFMDGGYPTCPKCKRELRNDSNGGTVTVCTNCGTDRYEYDKESMVSNLKKYGFKVVKVYEHQSFFQKVFTKQKYKHTIYKYGCITGRLSHELDEHVSKSFFNITLFCDGEKIGCINRHGLYGFVKEQIDDKIKPYMRRIKLERLTK